MKETKFNRAIVAMSYPLALLTLLGLLALIPHIYDVPLNKVDRYWRELRIIALISILPMSLYFLRLSILRAWKERVIYCFLNSFALYFVSVFSLVWLLIKSFIFLEWQIPSYDGLGLSLWLGVIISCATLFF